MRLTTKGRYAVTAMLDLALHASRGPVSLADISERQGISISYLEQLFAKLRRRELVVSVRGPGGGYQLSGDSRDISVASVIDAVDESVDATRCGGQGDCQEGERAQSFQRSFRNPGTSTGFLSRAFSCSAPAMSGLWLASPSISMPSFQMDQRHQTERRFS